MRIRCHKKGLPKSVRSHPKARGIVSAADVFVTRSARLRLKVVVFEKAADLRHFWREVLGSSDLGKRCIGAVSSLGYERVDRAGRSTLMVDPRYFAIMGLVKGHLTMEVITHESVHAAFSYARRQMRDLWVSSSDIEEERVCYPAGIIAKRINVYLHEEGLYRPEQVV